MKIFAGNANPILAREIASELRMPLGEALVTQFADGETRVSIGESVRGCDVFIIQPTCAPANDHIFELLIMIDACRRASARRITCVMPYFGYARQDRKGAPREPITAKLVADMLSAAGASRILTVELHTDQMMGFFNCPVDQLSVGPLFADHLKGHEIAERRGETVVVSPDVGGVRSAREFADLLGTQLVIIAKRRIAANHSEVMEVIGDVSDRLCIFRDDMIDTGGSMLEGAAALMNRGAASVMAVATHPVLSPGASERLASSYFERVSVTNTIPIAREKCFEQLEVLSVAPLVAQAIRCVHENRSVSVLFR
jgi:ribose-phosphate pyrophosphokinase